MRGEIVKNVVADRPRLDPWTSRMSNEAHPRHTTTVSFSSGKTNDQLQNANAKCQAIC